MFLWACGPGPFWKCFFSPSGRCFLLGHAARAFLPSECCFFLGLRPGFLRPPGIVLSGPAARAFSPSGRCSLWACGPGFFALRALFSLGLRPGLFCPPGILPPAGNFLLAQKVPQKRLPPVALRGLAPHSQPSWSFPQLRPSARVAGPRAKLGACQQQFLRPTACFQQAAT